MTVSDIRQYTAVLSMLEEPAFLVRGERVLYSNDEGKRLAGTDLTDRLITQLLPDFVVNSQAPCFAASVSINKQSYTVRMTAVNGYRSYILSADTAGSPPFEVMLSSLGTPVSNIGFAADSMLKAATERGDTELIRRCGVMLRSYYQINSVILNTVMLRDLRNGRVLFRPEQVDMTKLCSEAIALSEKLGFAGRAELSPDTGEGMTVPADPDHIMHILMSLLSNSLRCSGANGKIKITLHKTADMLVMQVDDNGCGITEEELPFVFSKYARTPDLTGHPGTGMSLPVSAGLARLHGGTVLIESAGRNRGTSVRVLLSLNTKANSRLSSGRTAYADGEKLRMAMTHLASCMSSEAFEKSIN